VAAAAKVRAAGSAGVYVTDDTAYLDAVRAEEQRRKDEAAAAEGRSVMAAANLKTLKEEIASLEDFLRKNPLLAMANGASYAGKPEWDTGMR
jgi:ABC-type molybdate transport system substrate-binding protein